VKVALLTREYPPEVYGGAGVHVEYLARELRKLEELTVHCWGADRGEPGVASYRAWEVLGGDAPHLAALQAMSIDLAMTAGVDGVDVVHSHTWYANLAGHLAKLVYGIPHVVTVHSLEPLRPWKAEQLGGGYRLSSWAERTAYEAADAVVAVSRGMRDDVLDCYPAIDPDKVHVISNGIDATFYSPDPKTNVLERLGVDLNRPYVTFVGRITRQKGVPHLLRAGLRLDPSVQLVLLAGAADTVELKAETDALIDELKAARDGVFVVSEMLPREDVRQVLTHALAFCCPSIYEPLGIVNLEAMACETAVVASSVGGIPEVVDDGVTGTLVRYDENDIDTFERDLAAGINDLIDNPAKAAAMGKAGRERAVSEFGWDAVADRTVQLYNSLLG
jgi:starch synthase